MLENINFHQTFRPEVQYISQILNISKNDDYYTIQEISKMTGIPTGESSGKVEPHILYANYMGLIDYEKRDKKYLLKRTKLGEAVYREDRGFHEKLTLVLIHSMLARESGASMWYYTLKRVLPKYRKAQSIDLIIKELSQENDKVSRKNFAPVISSYKEIFSNLNLVTVNDDSMYVSSMSIDEDFIYLYAFILFTLWDEVFPNENEITADGLKELKFKETFGWTNCQEVEVLEKLSDLGIIKFNRQLSPYTIVQLLDKDKIINKIYSLLL